MFLLRYRKQWAKANTGRKLSSCIHPTHNLTVILPPEIIVMTTSQQKKFPVHCVLGYLVFFLCFVLFFWKYRYMDIIWALNFWNFIFQFLISRILTGHFQCFTNLSKFLVTCEIQSLEFVVNVCKLFTNNSLLYLWQNDLWQPSWIVSPCLRITLKMEKTRFK